MVLTAGSRADKAATAAASANIRAGKWKISTALQQRLFGTKKKK